MRTFLFILVLAGSLTACRKTSTTRSSTVATPDTLIPGTFITTSGTFTHTDGMTTHSLEATQAGQRLSLSYGRSEELSSGMSTGISSATDKSISSPTASWFIYVESPERFWYFDGKSELSTFYADGGAGMVLSSGKIHPSCANVPREVVPRLPEDLQKLLPRVEPPVKRPSM